jgi:single-stranded-DNA-specific exonuclease
MIDQNALAPAGMPASSLPQQAGKPGVEVRQSLSGKQWVFTPYDERMAAAISQAHGLPELLGRLLSARGIAFDDVSAFLDPTLKSSLPDPSRLKDMDAAAARIAHAITAGEKVAVFGDYDVDGACSSALLMRYFRALGQDIRLYIPDRIAEGYGPNGAAMHKLAGEGVTLVITVDCGATAFEALGAAKSLGLDAVVLDHHRCEPQLPEAVAVVNPNRLDCDSGQGHMAACGVVFLTLVALNRLLRQRGWFAASNMAEPHVLQWLDLVALGTVCDVVPLTGINRAYVAQGLRVLGMRQNAGLVALCDVAGVDGAPSVFHLGYLLGPRVNAGGRVGTADMGARLLACDDPLAAKPLALKLHEYNAERRAIESEMIEEALARIAPPGDHDRVMLVAGDDWHPGVIGIVAARLKEKYNLPAAVIAFDQNGIGKASARSVPGIDLGGAVIAARQNGLLLAGGGHKMAAGFTVARPQLEALKIFLNKHADEQLNGTRLLPELRVDSVLSVPALQLALVEQLDRLGPYGAGHAEPRFVLNGVRIIKAKVVGENHVSCFIQDTAGGASVKAIAFRALDSALGDALLKGGDAPLHVAGHISVNEWMGRKTVQFQIVDAARSWTK